MLLVLCLAWPAATTTAWADDPPSPTKGAPPAEAPEFQTFWIGAKVELWYPPSLAFRSGVVGGKMLTPPQGSTKFGGGAALGLHSNESEPTKFDFPGPVRLEVFLDTRWFSASLWGFTPFEYTGTSTLQTDLFFGRIHFTRSTTVESTLAQTILGLDLELNIFNNRWVRFSPVLAVRALALNWTVHSVGAIPVNASTSDIDTPVRVGDYQVIPYPEIGFDLRVGLREVLEFDTKLTGLWFEVNGLVTRSVVLDIGLTGYLPTLPNLGLRVGYRYYFIDMDTGGGRDKRFACDLSLDGINVGIIARF